MKITSEQKQKIIKYLDKLSETFFPQSGEWKSYCYNRPYYLSENYFPCNTRNDVWLAKMMAMKIKETEFYVPYKLCLAYVKNSAYFNKLRNEYEDRIIAWQIDWIKHGGEGWTCSKKFGGEITVMFCDEKEELLRDAVIRTLSCIGIPKESSIKFLEQNKDLWFDEMLTRSLIKHIDKVGDITFQYAHYLNMSSFKGQKTAKQEEYKFEDAEKYNYAFRMYRIWLYEQNHKDDIDKYSERTCFTDNIDELKAYLDKVDKEIKKHYDLQRKKLNSENAND